MKIIFIKLYLKKFYIKNNIIKLKDNTHFNPEVFKRRNNYCIYNDCYEKLNSESENNTNSKHYHKYDDDKTDNPDHIDNMYKNDYCGYNKFNNNRIMTSKYKSNNYYNNRKSYSDSNNWIVNNFTN